VKRAHGEEIHELGVAVGVPAVESGATDFREIKIAESVGI